MYKDHCYSLHPSILCTNQQIECEARQVLYSENNLIRVKSYGFRLAEQVPHHHSEGHAMTILASGKRAKTFSRHAVELVISRWDLRQRWKDTYWNQDCFIIAGDDLPRLCHTLLVLNASEDLEIRLNQLALTIKVFGEDVTAPNLPRKAGLTLPSEKRSMAGETPSEDSSSKMAGESFLSDVSSKREAPNEEQFSKVCQATSHGKDTKTTHSSPRVLRLLEPLRELHSLYGLSIEGPIGEDYKSLLLHDMMGPPPTDEEMFGTLLRNFEDTLTADESGDPDSAFEKFKIALDTVNVQGKTRPEDWYGSAKIQTGPYTGRTVDEADDDPQMQDPVRARDYVDLIIGLSGGTDFFFQMPPLGHDIATLFHLIARSCDMINLHCRGVSHHTRLEDTAYYLKEGLRHEPGNPVLGEYLKHVQDELLIAQEFEELDSMCWSLEMETVD